LIFGFNVETRAVRGLTIHDARASLRLSLFVFVRVWPALDARQQRVNVKGSALQSFTMLLKSQRGDCVVAGSGTCSLESTTALTFYFAFHLRSKKGNNCNERTSKSITTLRKTSRLVRRTRVWISGL
jgi:hypothetical protein